MEGRYSLPVSFATPAPLADPAPWDAADVENRGLKRKIAGWVAPGFPLPTTTPLPNHSTTTTTPTDPPPPPPPPTQPSVFASAPPPPTPAIPKTEPLLSPIKREPHDVRDGKYSPSPAPVPSGTTSTQTYARMGTRVPGSGDLAGTGTRELKWPSLSGVRVGSVEEGEETVIEEECYTWTDLPMNKQGFRYIPCGPSPIPSPSPAHPFYRRIPALHTPFASPEPTSSSLPLRSPIHLDWLDRSTYLKISPSALTCTAEKGFRSVRGNVPVRSGAWYYECLIVRGGGDGADQETAAGKGPTSHRLNLGLGPKSTDTTMTNPRPLASVTGTGAHVRLGWGRREAPLNGPAGLDGYSYAIRDATGESVHLSRPKAYSHLGGFGTGDVIGCLIDLPARLADDQDSDAKKQKDPEDPGTIKRKRIPIRYKGQLYFESVEYTVPKEMDALVARDGRPVPEPVPIVEKPKPQPSPMKKSAATAARNKARAGKAVRKKPGKRDPESEEEGPGQARPRTLPRLTGSSIRFFLNGKPMAPHAAFSDVFDFLPLRQTEAELAIKAALVKRLGALEASLRDRENPCDDGTLGYYPFISCFGGGKVQFNPGPEWMAPVAEADWGLGTEDDRPRVPRPLSERWDEFYAEETVYDRADEEELTHLLRQEHAAETAAARKRVKSGAKGKSSVGKRASIAAAIQASSSIPISRGSSAVPSTSGGPGEQPEAYLATVVQDRGTPGGTPVPGTPLQASFLPSQGQAHEQPGYQQSTGPLPDFPQQASSPLHPASPQPPPPGYTSTPINAPSTTPLNPGPPQPYPIYTPASPSATSEDAIGEDDWSPAVSERMADDVDEPELPYGMEVVGSLAEGQGQIQERGEGPQL